MTAPGMETSEPGFASDSQRELDERRARRRITATAGARAYSAIERAQQLSDEGSFVELWPMRRARGDVRATPDGDGVVVGIGRLNGHAVAIVSHDFHHVGGSIGSAFAQKVSRLQDLALERGYPIVYLNDFGGARIQEGIEALDGCGDIFAGNVRARQRVPQISVILGQCAGAAAYSPALTDWTIVVRGQGQMFLTGPEVVRLATGEIVDPEDLGGATLHGSQSGVAHAIVEDEDAAFNLVRRLLSFWPQSKGAALPVANGVGPHGDAAAQLATVVPESTRTVFDMQRVLHGVLDEATWTPIMATHARSILTGFGRLDGIPVGIVASQPQFKGGVLDAASSRKVARLVNFCGRFGIPVITLVDVPGFLPGIEEERRGVITYGAEILAAYVEADVVKLIVVVRKAYGGAYIAMGSRSLGADMSWAWAGSELVVMGPGGAVGILHRRDLANAEDQAALRAELAETYRHDVTRPYLAAERGIIDEVIMPVETRPRLVDALHILLPDSVGVGRTERNNS